MTLGRLVPLALLLGGGGVVFTGGGAVGEQVVNTVKTVLTRYELSEAARLLELDLTIQQAKIPHRTADISKWLRNNQRARMERDPAMDLWEHPYVYVKESRARFGLRSHGADGQPDNCPNGSSGDRDDRYDDDICAWIEVDLGARSKGRRRR